MKKAPNVSQETNAPNASGEKGTGSESKDALARRRFELDTDVLEIDVDKNAKASLVEPFVETFGCFASADVETRDARDAQALRAERVRAEKRAAKGEIDSEDVREAILEVEELYRARAYAKDLARRRAAAERDAFERSLEDETREYREWQLAEFDVARGGAGGVSSPSSRRSVAANGSGPPRRRDGDRTTTRTLTMRARRRGWGGISTTVSVTTASCTTVASRGGRSSRRSCTASGNRRSC